jgi:uncharacterized protein YjbJ (UPF0337 family)
MVVPLVRTRSLLWSALWHRALLPRLLLGKIAGCDHALVQAKHVRVAFWPARMFGADLSGQRGPAPTGRDLIRGAENKAANKVTEVKGKIKKKAGQATDDAGLQAEGRAEESKGDLKQAGEKVKDAFKK